MFNTMNETDYKYWQIIRGNVNKLIDSARVHDKPGAKILEIGKEYGYVQQVFKLAEIKTLDIDPVKKADYVKDICQNTGIPANTFDIIFCTEVLEHTLEPKQAINEIYRILKKDGFLYMTVPLNFLIHSKPDMWRFTDQGLRYLLKDFTIIYFEAVDSEREAFPIQYLIVAKK